MMTSEREDGSYFLDKNHLICLGLESKESEIDDLLYSENWELFRKYAPLCQNYAEWGSGLSTFYVAGLESSKKIITVETDREWVSKITSVSIFNPEKIHVRYVDFGKVVSWGRPEGYSKIENVWNYSSAPFRGNSQPDLILVDGRFRVHCFLESLLKSKRGSKIVFDDYVNRPWYQIVERFIQPVEVSGRQALFVVNTRFSDRWKIRRLSRSFSYVMD